MSTRGLIAIEAADRSCRSIYVHFDLYPSGDPEPDAQDVCHAYHRDYGEKLCPPRVWADADEMLARAADAYWAEYVYLFRNGKWYVNTTYRPKEWRLVEEVLKERNNG